MEHEHLLNNNWSLYFHSKYSNEWKLDNYIHLGSFNTIEQFWKLYNSILKPEELMLFLMKNDIKPIWEDEYNKDGGTYAYRIHNNILPNIWTNVSCAVIGETVHPENESINGISISPKFHTSVLKIWVANQTVNPEDFTILKERGLPLFSKH